MSHLARITIGAAIGVIVAVAGFQVLAAPPKPPKEPAKIKISVSPDAVSRGGQTEVTLVLRPIEGVKINRYPQIKLEVPEQAGLVAQAEVKVGNSAPPAPDQKESNYFETVDPVRLKLQLNGSAPTGQHAVVGKLTYYYCVTASGFCAPKRLPIEIPIEVR
jgi:hypothetical protein